MASLYKRAFHFFYPPLCVHCKVPVASHREMLCTSCLSLLSLIDLPGRCVTCFTPLDFSLCPVCSQRERRVHRQLASVEKMGPGATLFFAALQGDRSVFPAIAALMFYQWTRLSYPVPDLIIPLSGSLWNRIKIGFDLNQHLASQIAKDWGIRSVPLLKRKWDRELFMTEGMISSQFSCRNKGEITDRSVLLVSLSLNDLLIQQAAKSLQPFFPHQIYALSFA